MNSASPRLARAIFFFVWGGLFAGWAILVAIDGEFEWGESTGTMIRAASDPAAFWAVIAAACACAAFGVWRGLVAWRSPPENS
jgi:hypothetical protein